MGWFSAACMLLVALVVLGLLIYAICRRTPIPKPKQRIGESALVISAKW